MSEKVRVRFAPSPTGYLHLGSARTALFNWLYVRHVNGTLVLRIEDTDKMRSKEEYLKEILEDLKWLGIDWDEGPFYQSKRQNLYTEEAIKILDKGLAYKEGNAIIYKVPKSKTIKINDLVHGQIIFNTDEIKDQVLIKSDGSPAYNFACVIDDSKMNITHIVRGDDHISNTPKQIMFYEALSLKIPQFAHMPLMMGKDKAKLSKRHGGVSVAEYKHEGFLPEALANYLLLLGWSPGEDKEIISLKEAIKIFDIKDINPVQVTFDVDKLRWLNGEYIKKRTKEELFDWVKNRLSKEKYIQGDIESSYLLRIIELYKTRFKTLNEFVSLTECLFHDAYRKDETAYKKHLSGQESRNLMHKFADRLEKLDNFNTEAIEKTCRSLAEEARLKAAKIIHPTRVAISGITVGAGLFDMMEVLGKDKVVERLKKV